MRAVVVTAEGVTSKLILSDVPMPHPQPDEIRIRVYAAGFNPSDYQIRQELTLGELPYVLGGEVAGIVDAIGSSVTGFTLNEPVYAYSPQKRGGNAEYVCIHEAFVAPKPRTLSFAQAAAVPVVGLTAYESLAIKAQLRAGQAVFIAGGSGGVGTLAIQLAQLYGANPIVVTAGSSQSVDYVRKMGIAPQHIVQYRERTLEALVEAVYQANNEQWYPVVLDCVGGLMTDLCCHVVDFDGQVVSIVGGFSSSANTNEEHLFQRSATFHYMLLYARAKFGRPHMWSTYATYLKRLAALIDQGQLQAPHITNVGSLSAATVQKAHMLLEAGQVQGKLVMSMNENGQELIE